MQAVNWNNTAVKRGAPEINVAHMLCTYTGDSRLLLNTKSVSATRSVQPYGRLVAPYGRLVGVQELNGAPPVTYNGSAFDAASQSAELWIGAVLLCVKVNTVQVGSNLISVPRCKTWHRAMIGAN